jgi:hypothetical protein
MKPSLFMVDDSDPKRNERVEEWARAMQKGWKVTSTACFAFTNKRSKWSESAPNRDQNVAEGQHS